MKENQENPLLNLGINIIIPVIALKQLSERINPSVALVVALLFPVGYFIFDYVKLKKKNLMSILGFVNIVLTGGLALFTVKGVWFAVKEAAFPLIIGLVIFISQYTKKPLMRIFVYNENFMDVPRVEQIIGEKNHEKALDRHFKKSTALFAYSFFLSAILNYVLARYIFVDIDPTLSHEAHQVILNEQIAKMTWVSFLVIALPLTLFMLLIGVHLNNGIRKLTNLKTEEIFPMLAVKDKDQELTNNQ
ncbi:MAG: hypothetical protein KDD50_08750 [Bdellovibrionales bacterium]|nr:hypothetical protein [Bdellovibrionales bacterium]